MQALGDSGPGMPLGGRKARGGSARAAAGLPPRPAGELQRTRALRRGNSRARARRLGPPLPLGRPPPLQGRSRPNCATVE